jgi:hypothetical protein
VPVRLKKTNVTTVCVAMIDRSNLSSVNLLSCDLQVPASWPIRPTGWRANSLPIAGSLGTCWPQHLMAGVFCLC